MQSPRVSNLLREYFELEMASSTMPHDFHMDTRVLPVAPRSESRWFIKQSPERLCRTYEFGSRGAARSFLNEIMDYEDERNHHASITCNGPNVTIEVFTHGVECVTEVDKEYANESELIYNDVCSYGYR